MQSCQELNQSMEGAISLSHVAFKLIYNAYELEKYSTLDKIKPYYKD